MDLDRHGEWAGVRQLPGFRVFQGGGTSGRMLVGADTHQGAAHRSSMAELTAWTLWADKVVSF